MVKRSDAPGRRQVLALLGGGILLAGCAGNAPSALYGLSAATLPEASGRARGSQILVPRPRALKALDSNYIAVVNDGPVYSYYPQAAWADALPNVVQSKIVETLQGTGRLRGVGFPGDGLLIDYQLQTEIRSFELKVDGANRGVVEIAAKLVNDRNGRAVATQVFRAETLSGGSSVDQAVKALNSAADEVFSDMAKWILQKV
ncbi:ABC-type transport auxiliary lipoprotein family protein [uncultured Roseibium sp.]|uniref:ABC-type transport auxiliary lipoprotein family protein n=1 Tax=uncultured Roseibium sp. TaxID=1936171 RepID=UPI002595E898|nr:ABC-type transport auxiliary lipoprotein family protein [uncultured Roseibium sp.]